MRSSSSRHVRVLSIFVVAGSWLGTAAGQCEPVERYELRSSDGGAGQRFGLPAVGLGYFLVGAPGATGAALGSGAVYEFKRSGSGWSQSAKLLASDGASGDGFGLPAVDGFRTLVGAPLASTSVPGSGAAYFFERAFGVWSQRTKLVASNAQTGAEFGSALALSGEWAVVGAPGHDGAGLDAGAAYVFHQTPAGWTEEALLAASDAASGARFGASVHVAYGRIVIGAPLADTAGGIDAGAAYVFELVGGTWTEVVRLTASNGVAGDHFGNACLHVNGPVLVAASDHSGGAGQVYEFEFDGAAWYEGYTMVPPLPDRGFGRTLNWHGGRWFTIGAQGVAERGAVYIAEPGDPQPRWRLEAADGVAGDSFEHAALAGDLIVIGAPGADDLGSASGSAYVFDLDHWPNIVAPALDALVDLGQPAQFSASVEEVDATEYRWLRDGVLLADGGRISGATTATLSISAVEASDDAVYRLVVTNPCTSAGGEPWDMIHADARLTVVCGPAEEQLPTHAWNVQAGQRFGADVALARSYPLDPAHLNFGNLPKRWLLAGAPDEAPSGAAYFFERSGESWTQTYKWLPPSPELGGAFGSALDAILGPFETSLVAGAPLADPQGIADAGAVSVLVYEQGLFLDTMQVDAPDPEAGDHFGADVGILGEALVVGVPGDDDRGSDSGSVWGFVTDGPWGWMPMTKISALDGQPGDHFGQSLAFRGALAVGAPDDDETLTDQGSVYVYATETHTSTPYGFDIQLMAKLVSPEPTSGGHFGQTVALGGDVLLVGAPDESPAGLGGAGAVHAYRWNGAGWAYQARLTSADLAASDRFGSALSIDSCIAAIGSSGGTTSGVLGSGAAYLFDLTSSGWLERTKLVPASSAAGDGLGTALFVERDFVALGMPGNDGVAADSGAALVFDVGGDRPYLYCTARKNSLNCIPWMTLEGTPRAGAVQGFQIVAHNFISQKFGMLVYGIHGQVALPFHGGTMCVGLPRRRTILQNSGGSTSPPSDCSGVLAIDFNAFATGAAGGSPSPALSIPGVEVDAQWWGRDPGYAPESGAQLSRAIRFVMYP